MPTLTTRRPPVKSSRSSKPQSRLLRWLYRHPGPEVKGAIRLAISYARRTYLFRYWVEQVPSDFGTAYKLTKIEADGSDGEVYDVCSDGATRFVAASVSRSTATANTSIAASPSPAVEPTLRRGLAHPATPGDRPMTYHT